MIQTYVPLQVFSAFSLQDSIIEVGALLDRLENYQIAACALTDRSNIFALVSFYKKALKKGIKPLIGSHVSFTLQGRKLQASLYCKNIDGYRKLSAALSNLFKAQPFTNQLDIHHLQADQDLLIILQQEDIVHYAENFKEIVQELEKIFNKDDIFLGLERYEQDKTSFAQSEKVIDLASKYELSCVAANKVFFLEKKDYQSQQIKYCIQKGLYMDDQNRPIKHFQSQYLYSYEKISQLYANCSQALKNTLIIAQKCSLEIDFNSIFLPEFSADENFTLKQMAVQGLSEREEKGQLFEQDRSCYEKRLDRELEVIKTMGFAGYFLIVADFIQWAKNTDIPVGPGRGSGAGSLVAYALKITDLDPLRYNLLFERFLNPERVSMPDFDIDFCMDKRDRVIHYVQNRYGHNNVSQIATFGTMAAKAVVRDVGRVLHHPYGFVDKVAKLIPLDLGMTLNQALEQSAGLKSLYHEDEVVKELIDLALQLEGLPRNIGKHAGGVIIAPKSLDYFCPLYNEPNTPWHPVSGLDKDDIETLGLVKFDFLGLKTLTILDWTYANLTAEEKENLPILENLPLDCQKSYEQLQNAHTTAVFQLESRGMKQLILKLQPDCFEDMIALVALFRPGPLQSGMVDDFIDRKHGRAPIVYLHPDLEEILKPTYGVILYQEQVMQIAQVLAGYSLGQADLLRRAMGKKKPEEMAKQRVIFLEGCSKNAIDESVAGDIFDIMEKFAGYGFNKSHSAAYALIAYQTLYLKTHVKEAFFAANMSADHGNLDKIKNLILDAQTDNIEVLPPCVNRSELHFKPYGPLKITYGLKAVKGLGEQVIEMILQERNLHGPFESFDDFMRRTSSMKIQKRTLEIMAYAGLFDLFTLNRRSLIEDLIEKKVHQYYKTCQKQGLLFEFDDQQLESEIITDYLWSQKLKKEQTLLGLSFSGELLDPYKAIKQEFFKPLKSFTQGHSDRGLYLAFAYSARELTTAAGKRLAILGFYDAQYNVDILIDKEKNLDLLELYQNQQSTGMPLVVSLERTTGRQKKKYTQMKNLLTLEKLLEQKASSFLFKTKQIDTVDEAVKNFLQEISHQSLGFHLFFELIDQHTQLSEIFNLTQDDPEREDFLEHSQTSLDKEQSQATKYSEILTIIEKSYALSSLSLEIK